MNDFPNLSELLDEGYAMRGPKQWPMYHGGKLDRTKYVSASEVGGCSRRIKFGKVSRPLGFDRWGFAERGHIIEAWAIDLIREALYSTENEAKYGVWSLIFSGERQFSFADGYQSGTPDGLLLNNETHLGLVLDVKSVDPRTNYDRLPKAKQVKQVLQNIDLINRTTPYTAVGGILFYIDASDLQRRKLVQVEDNEDVRMALRDKAQSIMSAKEPKDLAAEGLYMDGECKTCPYGEKCGAQIEADNEAANQMKQLERAMIHVIGKHKSDGA